MTNQKTPALQVTLARIVSVVFHPLFMPVYGLAIIFTAPTVLAYLPLAVKKLLFLIVLTNNVLVPTALLPFLINRGVISSYSISDRRERIIPLVMISILYSITSYIVFRFQIPVFLKTFVFSATLLVMAVTIITFFWKISVHAAGAGALTAVVFLLSVKMYSPLSGHLIAIILLSGIILSSRLRLNSHDPAQVWGGFFTGMAGICLFVLIF